MDTCPVGHERTAKNTRRYVDGTVVCLTCQRTEYHRERRARMRETEEGRQALSNANSRRNRRRRENRRAEKYAPWGSTCCACGGMKETPHLRLIMVGVGWRTMAKFLVCHTCLEIHKGNWPPEVVRRMVQAKAELNLED